MPRGSAASSRPCSRPRSRRRLRGALADAWPTAPLARDDSDREHNRRWQQFQETLRRTDAAIHAITSGNPQPYIALWANSPDVTLFGAWGPIRARGPDALRATFEWVGGRFGPAGGLESEHEVVQMSGSLAYTVGFERGLAQVDGRPPAPMTIRVTHMFPLRARPVEADATVTRTSRPPTSAPVDYSARPWRTAHRAACVRSETPSLASTWPTWVLTLFSATPSSSAMRLLERPRAMRQRTSRSARREIGGLGRRGAARRHLLEQTGGHGRREQAVAVGDGADAGDELGRVGVLEQVARGTGAHRAEHALVVAEAGQCDRPRIRHALARICAGGSPSTLPKLPCPCTN